jgi:hypothetical protein
MFVFFGAILVRVEPEPDSFSRGRSEGKEGMNTFGEGVFGPKKAVAISWSSSSKNGFPIREESATFGIMK